MHRIMLIQHRLPPFIHGGWQRRRARIDAVLQLRLVFDTAALWAFCFASAGALA